MRMVKPRKALEDIKKEENSPIENWRLKLDKNENVYGCNPSVLSIIKNTKEEDIYLYSNTKELIEKISIKYSIPHNYILFSSNTNEALKNIFDAYLEKEDLITVFQTNKNFINTYSKLNNVRVLNLANKEQISKNSKIVYISTPNNITGNLIRASYIEELLKEYQETLFVVDCSYINFAINSTFEDFIDLIKKYNNVILIKSFSKDFALAGLGFNLMIAQEDIIKNISKISTNFINSISLNCISIIINDEKRMQEIKELNQKAKDLFVNNLIEKNFKPYDSEANFILCDFKEYCDFYYEKLKQNGIIVKNFKKEAFFNSCLRITVPTIGGVKFINELLNKKDVLIFSDDVLLDYNNIQNNFTPLFYKNSIQELAKKYDLVIFTKYEVRKIKDFLNKHDIEKYFYYIYSSNDNSTPDFEGLNKLKENCPHNEIKLISSDVQNIIAANMTNTKTIAVIMPNADFNHTMNNYKHLGIKNILSDYKNLEDFITQLDNSNKDVDNFIIN